YRTRALLRRRSGEQRVLGCATRRVWSAIANPENGSAATSRNRECAVRRGLLQAIDILLACDRDVVVIRACSSSDLNEPVLTSWQIGRGSSRRSRRRG